MLSSSSATVIPSRYSPGLNATIALTFGLSLPIIKHRDATAQAREGTIPGVLEYTDKEKKMNKVKGFFSIILLVTLFVFQSAAQQGWEAGAWIGTSHYFGDLNTNFDLTKPGPAGGVTARYNINDRVCLKSAFSYGLIQETDEVSSNPFERSRNLHFKSNIFDLTNQFEFNFMPYIHGTSNYFTPYFLLGLSVFHYEPKAKYEGNWYKLFSSFSNVGRRRSKGEKL